MSQSVLFDLPALSPSQKAKEMLGKKTVNDCLKNVQSLINCTEIHPELIVMHLYWIEVLKEVETKSNVVGVV